MAQLIIDSGENKGKAYEVANNAIIGRSESNSVYLDDQKASREHSRITEEADGFYVADLNSRNGTLVNGKKITKQKISDGDLILIGRTYLRFKSSSAGGEVSSLEPADKQSRIANDIIKQQGYPAAAKEEKSNEGVSVDQNKKKTAADEFAKQINTLKTESEKKPEDGEMKESQSSSSRVLMIILAVIFFAVILFAAKWVGEKVFMKMMKSQKANSLENSGNDKK